MKENERKRNRSGKNSATVISVRCAIVDWSWPKKSGSGVRELIATTKKKKTQLENEALNFPPKSSQARKNATV